jgi:putative flippase GtrA
VTTSITRQVSAFFIVGIIATSVHIASAWFALWLFPVTAPYANIFGNLIALPVAYLGHTKYTFKKPIGFQRFLLYAANNYAVFTVSLATAFLLEIFNVNGYVNIFTSAMIFPLASFFLHKFITFKAK